LIVASYLCAPELAALALTCPQLKTTAVYGAKERLRQAYEKKAMRTAGWRCAKWVDMYGDTALWPKDDLPPYSPEEIREYKQRKREGGVAEAEADSYYQKLEVLETANLQCVRAVAEQLEGGVLQYSKVAAAFTAWVNDEPSEPSGPVTFLKDRISYEANRNPCAADRFDSRLEARLIIFSSNVPIDSPMDVNVTRTWVQERAIAVAEIDYCSKLKQNQPCIKVPDSERRTENAGLKMPEGRLTKGGCLKMPEGRLTEGDFYVSRPPYGWHPPPINIVECIGMVLWRASWRASYDPHAAENDEPTSERFSSIRLLWRRPDLNLAGNLPGSSSSDSTTAMVVQEPSRLAMASMTNDQITAILVSKGNEGNENMHRYEKIQMIMAIRASNAPPNDEDEDASDGLDSDGFPDEDEDASD